MRAAGKGTSDMPGALAHGGCKYCGGLASSYLSYHGALPLRAAPPTSAKKRLLTNKTRASIDWTGGKNVRGSCCRVAMVDGFYATNNQPLLRMCHVSKKEVESN